MNLITDYSKGYIIDEDENTLTVDLAYPNQNPVNQVEVGLIDVRAADSILIRYDFERNGWSILQATTFEWDAEDTVCDPDWQEVAFVPAWGSMNQNLEKEQVELC